jgi:pimeloyl-ACP methyl ester carboxylesterase
MSFMSVLTARIPEGQRPTTAGPRRALRVLSLSIPLAAIFCGCFVPRPTTIPVPTIRYPVRPEGKARTLVIFLPGRKSEGGDFDREGFIRMARERGVDADLIEADLHWGYYLEGSYSERLWEDVVRPARAAGYRKIWLVGISLGGSGALGFTREHPGTLAGLVLLSPYLGPPAMSKEIRKAGGLRRWKPAAPAAPGTFERFFEEIWGTLKRLTVERRTSPILYLGYGRNERLAPSHALLAESLPAQRVIRVPGEHRWGTWKALWAELLARHPFDTSGAEKKRASP